eukprot:scaffold1987_cov145-Amphora_coffeaeformis.AAC.1
MVSHSVDTLWPVPKILVDEPGRSRGPRPVRTGQTMYQDTVALVQVGLYKINGRLKSSVEGRFSEGAYTATLSFFSLASHDRGVMLFSLMYRTKADSCEGSKSRGSYSKISSGKYSNATSMPRPRSAGSDTKQS